MLLDDLDDERKRPAKKLQQIAVNYDSAIGDNHGLGDGNDVLVADVPKERAVVSGEEVLRAYTQRDSAFSLEDFFFLSATTTIEANVAWVY